MIDNDKEDILVDSFAKLIDGACEIVAASKQKQVNVTQVVYVDNDGNDAVINVYDFYYYIWKSGDTLDSVANELLGNAEYGTVIAYFNKIQNEVDIETGSKIKIPVLTENESNTNNIIYATPDKQDNYGIDIAINEKGDFDFLDNDFKTVGNSENLSQSIAMRLTTASQKRIRLTSYGIKTNIGNNNSIENYLTGSIEQTIKADPRIKTVEEISFKGLGDKLFCEVVYTDINGENGTFEGTV